MIEGPRSKVKVTILARPFGTGIGVAETAEEAVAQARRELKRLYPDSRPAAYRVATVQGTVSSPVVGETSFQSWDAVVQRANRAVESLQDRAA